MTYRKGTPEYKVLTDYVREWANRIVLQLAKGTPDDYVLVMCVEKETGEPYGPRGMIRSLAAALGVIDSHKGLIPPNWGHTVQRSGSNGIPACQTGKNALTEHNYSSLDDCDYRQQDYAQDIFRQCDTKPSVRID